MSGNQSKTGIGTRFASAFLALSAAQFFVPNPVWADEDPAPAAADATAAAAPSVPRPSEMAPRAVSNPLLKVVNNGQRYVAVGARGHILVSTDGNDWKQVASPSDVLLTSVTFADAQNGWAVGHDALIMHTGDGGLTWKIQNYQPELNKPLFDVLFLDANRGFAIGAYGLFLSTTDGGEHWAPMAAPALLDGEKHMNAMTKLGDGSLVIVGEAGLIGLSSDQGQTWTKLESPYSSSLFAVLAAGDKGALIAGLRGSSYWTGDVHSPKWSKINTQSVQSLFGIAALPGDQIGMVGLDGTLLVFDATGSVRQIPILDKDGIRQSDSLSWLTVAKDGGVILVGDAGVQRIGSIKK